MKTWLCGPASADRSVYESAESALRTLGIIPSYGPHDLTYQPNAGPHDVAAMRLRMLIDCEQVCLLDGWSSCNVADFEVRTAKHLGRKCTPLVILLSGG